MFLNCVFVNTLKLYRKERKDHKVKSGALLSAQSAPKTMVHLPGASWMPKSVSAEFSSLLREALEKGLGLSSSK